MSKVATGLCMWPLCKENNGSNIGLYGRLYCEKHAQIAEGRRIAKVRAELRVSRVTHCRNCSDEQYEQCYSEANCLDLDKQVP